MKEIPLYGSYKPALVDDDWFEPLTKMGQWNKFRSRTRVYAVLRGTIGGTLFMHNVILPHKPGLEVDHIDGDSLNNQITNLRYATHQQNCANSKAARRRRARKGLIQ